MGCIGHLSRRSLASVRTGTGGAGQGLARSFARQFAVAHEGGSGECSTNGAQQSRFDFEHGKLLGETALITGAGSGIGRQAALLFAQEGASVVVSDRNIAAAARTVDALKEFGGRGYAVAGDVSKPEDVEAMVAKAEKTFGALNILFNNAGIMDSEDGDAVETSDDVIDRTLAVNVKGVIYGCRYVLSS